MLLLDYNFSDMACLRHVTKSLFCVGKFGHRKRREGSRRNRLQRLMQQGRHQRGIFRRLLTEIKDKMTHIGTHLPDQLRAQSVTLANLQKAAAIGQNR